MSMKAWRKLDKFYPMLFFVMLVLAALAIYSFRQIFSILISAYETQELKDSELKIDQGRLDDAYKAVLEKENVPLKVIDGTIIVEEEPEESE